MRKFSLFVSFLAVVISPCLAATDTIFCYFTTKATYRKGIGKVEIENIDPNLCTHVLYAYVGLTSSGRVNILDPWKDISLGGLNKFQNLRTINPNIKLLVAMGGDSERSVVYSNVANSPNLRSRMVSNVVTFCKKYKFDGFSFDWEYPGLRGGAPTDRVTYIEVLKALRTRFDSEGLILTTAVGAAPHFLSSSYNAPEMTKYVNYILLVSFDFRTSYRGVTGNHAALYASSNESSSVKNLNVDASVQNWLNSGVPPEKLILGVPFYGVTFTLADRNSNGLGAPTIGPGPAGIDGETGILNYVRICKKVQSGDLTTVYQTDAKVPYSYRGTEWISYDNVESVMGKVEYAKNNTLGGVMIYSLDQDDVQGHCGTGKYPLLTAIKNALA